MHSVFYIKNLDINLHHFMLFDIFLKRSKDAETRCNEDIDLSDGFKSIVYRYLTSCKILT